MNWPKLERFALDGPTHDDWKDLALFWPWMLATIFYLLAAPVRDWLIRHRFIK